MKKEALKDLTFKTAFKATLGYYAAQATITIGVVLFIAVVVVVGALIKVTITQGGM